MDFTPYQVKKTFLKRKGYYLGILAVAFVVSTLGLLFSSETKYKSQIRVNYPSDGIKRSYLYNITILQKEIRTYDFQERVRLALKIDSANEKSLQELFKHARIVDEPNHHFATLNINTNDRLLAQQTAPIISQLLTQVREIRKQEKLQLMIKSIAEKLTKEEQTLTSMTLNNASGNLVQTQQQLVTFLTAKLNDSFKKVKRMESLFANSNKSEVTVIPMGKRDLARGFWFLFESLFFTTMLLLWDSKRLFKVASESDLIIQNIPCLGTIPREPEQQQFPLENPSSTDMKQAFHKITSQLINTVDRGSILLITSPSQACGKTFFASHLAMTLASIGRSVLLIDLDLRLPSIKNYLNLPASTNGITSSPRKFYDWDKDIFKYSHNMDILCCPKGLNNAPEILERQILKSYLESKKKIYDYVLLDSPPVKEFSDVSLISQYASANILVLNSGSHTLEDIGHCKSHLTLAQSLPVFGVLNRFS